MRTAISPRLATNDVLREFIVRAETYTMIPVSNSAGIRWLSLKGQLTRGVILLLSNPSVTKLPKVTVLTCLSAPGPNNGAHSVIKDLRIDEGVDRKQPGALGVMFGWRICEVYRSLIGWPSWRRNAQWRCGSPMSTLPARTPNPSLGCLYLLGLVPAIQLW